MALTYIGSQTIGDTLPAVVGVLAYAFADLQARITALADASLSITPPGLELELAASILAAVQANLALGITPPSIDLQISLLLALMAELQIQLGIVLDLQNLFATAGVHVYVYGGQADAMGGEITAELAGGFPSGAPTDFANAIIIATTIPATWIALSQVFKVTP